MSKKKVSQSPLTSTLYQQAKKNFDLTTVVKIKIDTTVGTKNKKNTLKLLEVFKTVKSLTTT